MKNKENIESLIRGFIAECQVDHDGLWRIIKNVEEELHITNSEEIHRITYDIIRAMLNNGIVAGNFITSDDSFHIWNMSNDDIIAKVDREWTALGRNPNINEIVNFTAAKNTS